MNKYLITLICVLILLSSSVYAADNMTKVTSRGTALIGSGITLDQAEQLALKLAKKEAVNKFGTYIESKTIVKDHKLTSREITTLSAGVVKLVPDSKQKTKKLVDGQFLVEVKADFIINQTNFKTRIKNYLQQKKTNSNLKELIAKISQLEAKLENISQQTEIDSIDLKCKLEKIKQSYQKIDSALKIEGQQLLTQLKDKRLERFKEFKLYLKKLKRIAEPYKIFDLKLGQPTIKDKGANKIELKVPIEIDYTAYYDKLNQITSEYRKILYPLRTQQKNKPNTEVDNLTSTIFDLEFRRRLILAFVDKDDRVIAFKHIETDMASNTIIKVNNDGINFVSKLATC